ncbi:MAG: HAD family hydrolase [Proteobacteria bacterium]|nr:HAD family hydrolase [Pseudomonadota bacterium]
MVHIEFIGRTLPLMKKHQGWAAAYQALKEGSEAIKKPSKTKTNHERMIENFARHFRIDFEAAEKEVRDNLNHVFPKLKSHFGKIQGAAKFLDWARNHYSLTLATNPVWPIELVHMRMAWGGIDPALFPSITTADRMHACKPHKEYYLELLSQEKFEAHECLMIGNERKMDLPATAAGVSVFLLRTDAKSLTCIEAPAGKHPGAWRGNYTHLKHLLQLQQET